MKKRRLLKLVLVLCFAISNLRSQTTFTLISKVRLKEVNDEITIKVFSTDTTNLAINDTLIFFEINQNAKRTFSGVVRSPKNKSGENKLFFYLPIVPTYSINNTNCYNIALLFLYNPTKGTIDDISCPGHKKRIPSSKFNKTQAILDVLKFFMEDYFKP